MEENKLLQYYKNFDSDIVNSYITKNNSDYEGLAKYFLKILSLIRKKGDNCLYIYNIKGYYEPLERWFLSSFYKSIINESGLHWDSFLETNVIGALLRDCKTEIEDFNTQNAVNFQNGVFFLDEGDFVSHSPKIDLFTNQLDYKFEKTSECPMFQQFINETFLNDKELILVVQEVLGYCLSVKNDAEKAFFFYGGGCNGKSVLASVIHSLIGIENTCAVSLEAINDKFSGSNFIGKKVNIAAENENLSNSEKLKTLISGDRINLPVKYKNDWSGTLFTKHIFLMNSLPETPDLTNGFFRKILVIPFNNTISADNIDRNLTKKLKTELPGIFNWAYIGYLRLVKNDFNFTHSTTIEKITKEYQERENHTGTFFNDNYIKCGNGKEKKSEMYFLYESWCANEGIKPMSRTKFHNALNLKSKEKNSDIVLDYRKHNGIMYLIGYKLKEKDFHETVSN